MGGFLACAVKSKQQVEVQDPAHSVLGTCRRGRGGGLAPSPSLAAQRTATLWMSCLLFPETEQEKEKDPFNYGETNIFI